MNDVRREWLDAARLFGWPVVWSDTARLGEVMIFANPGYLGEDPKGRTLIVGTWTPGPLEADALRIVRDAMADTLHWLGEEPRPWWLQAAIDHFHLDRRPA